MSKTKFENIQTTVVNHGATIKTLETQIANNDPSDHLSKGSIATWKELEDKFLERFFTHTLFQKRKSEILSFKQHESETLCEAYERFKLLMTRCPNHSISAMEQMQLFTAGMKMQHHMILDTSAGGSIKVKTYAETKDLVEQMCQNEYNISHDRNEKTPGILKVDQEIAYKVEIELLKRQLAEKEKAVKEDSVKQVEGVCDFSLEDHPNGHCLPQGSEEQAKYMGNGNNPELLNKFASMSKTKFENIQTTVANQGATIKTLETQIANNDPWDHLSKFSETCQIQKVPKNVTEDQKKMRLFAFSLIGPAKDWLQCLPRGSIATWKELEDKFLERFFTHTLFQKRKSDILSFKQHESETLCEAYERFKLLMRRCPNHNISAIEQMQLFTAGMKMQHHMILDASAGGSIKFKTYAETKDLVEQMCENEYNISHDRNEKTPGILKVDQEIAYKVEIELLKRQLAEKEKAVKEDSVK
ncbi:hypothetical protein QL285_093910 [Trifolium repens]|nr:hypothetical protein QL285_093910 [Trifolium repens]